MKELSKKERMRAWAKKHRDVLHLIASMLKFILAMIFFAAAGRLFFIVSDGAVIMAGVILLMIAGFFWKGATNVQDEIYKERSALGTISGATSRNERRRYHQAGRARPAIKP